MNSFYNMLSQKKSSHLHFFEGLYACFEGLYANFEGTTERIHCLFKRIYTILWMHVSMSPKRRLGSTHSTGSLEGVTFLAVAIVDKKI